MGTAVKDPRGRREVHDSFGSRKGKPHRVITGSEDFRVRFYTGGPPFQLEQRERVKRTYATNAHHEKYINEVRMSRDDKYVFRGRWDWLGTSRRSR